ncbi:T9SS type A sorting domain-containing protein [Marixanthomonas spongiae]|nr:T9SS type A sorting domain-containing protein [Marixanthomonas spongiae]
MKKLVLLFLLVAVSTTCFSQSIARTWNEEVLHGIRNDFARPVVHARNLFHTSVAMYDVWAVFDKQAAPYFLGNTIGDYTCEFEGFKTSENTSEATKKALSYAVFRLMKHRFQNSPGKEEIFKSINQVMNELGYDINYISSNYKNGNPAALGNYIAEQLIAFGLQDGSNEANDYENRYYEPLNEALNLDFAGNSTLEYPNHWQPLKVENWVDQSGNTIPGGQPPFLGPEWGAVVPFSLREQDLTTHTTPDFDYNCYYDPGDPWYIQDFLGMDDPYKWSFAMVAVWSSHLDPADGVMIDISPASIGNFDSTDFPTTFKEYKSFYNYKNGGDPSKGRDLNPVTGKPYRKQLVPRGDYARVLAEFWADGPDSETPPGHWFTILNYVNDQPELIKKFKGRGEVLSDLEWDIKSYFTLGGAMHDVAISAWGIKGYYDYVRPVSAIRYMSDEGQSSDPNLPRYNPHGIPLVENYIELVQEGDPLAGAFNENVEKIKLYCWRGPSKIVDPNEDEAGVGWILAEEWFPYQRPSFVTPPFAGYVSGHSTFSRAAAEILTLLTGDPFFPGGMGTFEAKKGEFLVFEDGPSVDVQLQWATYRDASDQCSLSRIWGGIHPPIDDIPGRIIGEKLGKHAFAFAENFFTKALAEKGVLYPNPTSETVTISYNTEKSLYIKVYDIQGREVLFHLADFGENHKTTLDVSALRQGIYFVTLQNTEKQNLFTARLLKK